MRKDGNAEHEEVMPQEFVDWWTTNMVASGNFYSARVARTAIRLFMRDLDAIAAGHQVVNRCDRDTARIHALNRLVKSLKLERPK